MVLVLAEIACAVSVAWHASNFWDIAVFFVLCVVGNCLLIVGVVGEEKQ